MTPRERFWARVDRSAGFFGCWPWTGWRSVKGYGMLQIDHKGRFAHRISYELAVGSIPAGLTIDHLCRVRHCVNPTHLEPVTNRENILRGLSPSALAARQVACVHGHPFSTQNTQTRADGSRRCRTCQRAADRAYYHRQRASQNTSPERREEDRLSGFSHPAARDYMSRPGTPKVA